MWAKIRNGTKPSKVHWTRIESRAGPGVPDVNGCYKGLEVWLELKLSRGNRVLLSEFQTNWIDRRIAAGGVAWIIVLPIVQRPPEYFPSGSKPPILLYFGDQARGVMEQGIALRPRAMLCAPYDWDAFVRTVFSAPPAIDNSPESPCAGSGQEISAPPGTACSAPPIVA